LPWELCCCCGSGCAPHFPGCWAIHSHTTGYPWLDSS
jgi:hypothetical protein